MITALATVVSVDATEQGSRLELSCEQQTSCSHCSSRSSCGTGIVSKAVGNKSHSWTLITDKSVKAGQTVEIGLSERNLIGYASVVYLLPIFALILGAAISEQFLAPVTGMGEGLTIGVSVLSMLAGILLARSIAKRLQAKSQQSVSLIRVLGETLETK